MTTKCSGCHLCNKVILLEDTTTFARELFYCIQLIDDEIYPFKPEVDPYVFLTENILKASRVTFVIFHEYIEYIFMNIFYNSFFPYSTKKLCLDWLALRENVFVKVLDTIAFAIGIYNYVLDVECEREPILAAGRWFCEMFQENLRDDFYKEGGWDQLDKLSEVYYTDLYNKFRSLMQSDFFEDSIHSHESYDCVLINAVIESPVYFPIPKDIACSRCRQILDHFDSYNMVYMMSEKEYNDLGLDNSDEAMDDETMDDETSIEDSAIDGCDPFDDESDKQQRSCPISKLYYTESTCKTYVEFEMGKVFIKELKNMIVQGKPQSERDYEMTCVNLVSRPYTDSFDFFLKKTYLRYSDITDLSKLKENFQKIFRLSWQRGFKSQKVLHREDQVVREQFFPFFGIKFKHWTFEFYFLGKKEV